MLKVRTHEDYLARLNRVHDYVYAHLEDDISFDRLAEVACLSPYHWSRIYSAMRGETIVATIRRLRLQRAADRLANSDLEIGVVAAHARYSSTDTFGRAFREAFGVPERHCASIGHTGSYMAIDHAMGRLFTELAARRSLPPQPTMIGVFFDDPDLVPEAELRSRACLPLARSVAVEVPLETTVLRGGLHAKLNYTGPYAGMRSAYRWFLGVWLPASGHEPDDAPVFEAYLDDPREVPQHELRTDIHLPLKAAP